MMDNSTPQSVKRVLIDATKLPMSGMDGCKRYVLELVSGLYRLQRENRLPFEVDLFVGGTTLMAIEREILRAYLYWKVTGGVS